MDAEQKHPHTSVLVRHGGSFDACRKPKFILNMTSISNQIILKCFRQYVAATSAHTLVLLRTIWHLNCRCRGFTSSKRPIDSDGMRTLQPLNLIAAMTPLAYPHVALLNLRLLLYYNSPGSKGLETGQHVVLMHDDHQLGFPNVFRSLPYDASRYARSAN